MSDTTNLGKSGELAVLMILTRIAQNGASIFRAAAMEGGWPTTDIYVEVITDSFPRPHFFIQVKTTEKDFLENPKRLPATLKRIDERRLLHIPAPTYLVAVKPEKRLLGFKAYIRSIHQLSPHAIKAVSTSCPLTANKLLRLRDEVLAFWQGNGSKPTTSIF